jgi:hypothetical protein
LIQAFLGPSAALGLQEKDGIAGIIARVPFIDSLPRSSNGTCPFRASDFPTPSRKWMRSVEFAEKVGGAACKGVSIEIGQMFFSRQVR